MASHPVIVIPAYRPGAVLTDLVKSLVDLGRTPSGSAKFEKVIVVNDGSGPEYEPIFEALRGLPQVLVLEHAVNLGKGQALKTAFNATLVHFPNSPGVVTMDADGQHLPEDVLRIVDQFNSQPDTFVLGKRELEKDVPLRSAFGNGLTRMVFHVLVGKKIHDTQTGLRAIPRKFLRTLLRLKSQGYEFELDMLILAARDPAMPVVETSIKTVYEPGNPTSHFNPIVDSLKIYFVFFRFVFSSILTAGIDWVVFWTCFSLGQSILTSSVIARIFAGTFNFTLGRRWVFHSSGSVPMEATKYVFLVLLTMGLSYGGILLLTRETGMGVAAAKLLTEAALFLLSFSAQRVWVFLRQDGGADARTNWDEYYERPVPTASVTRKITTRKLIRCLRYYPGGLSSARIIEWGGANSCFYKAIASEVNPEHYTIADLNQTGLKKFVETHGAKKNVELHQVDVLQGAPQLPKSDIGFSVGLIEHFDPAGTEKAIETHFRSVKPGGLVVITFPTPTFLYVITRTLAEMLGVWRFPDERPLKMQEVKLIVQRHGRILHEEINWPIILTQGIIVAVSTPEEIGDASAS